MLNERLREISNPADAVTEYHCECSNEACLETVAMDLEEYAAVRWLPQTFLVAPGHDRPGADILVTTTDRFLLVGDGAASPDNLEEVITAINERASSILREVGERPADPRD